MHNTLFYNAQEAPRKGTLHLFTLPQSVELHISPSACGRKHAMHNNAQPRPARQVHLYVTDTDITSGNYEQMVADAVEELLETLPERPRAIVLFTSCLDRLIGVDHSVMLRMLRERWPDVAFCLHSSTPATVRRKRPVAQDAKYMEMMRYAPGQARAINLVGNIGEMAQTCEIFALCEQMGVAVRQVHTSGSFEEFEKMGESIANVALTRAGLEACEEAQKRYGMPYINAVRSYDASQIAKIYEQIAQICDCKLPDISEYSAACDALARRVRERLGEMPVIIDHTCDENPLALADALIAMGLNVRAVLIDATQEEWVSQRWRRAHPSVQIIGAKNTFGYENRLGECLCIGEVAGKVMGSERVVGFESDAFEYGFDGLCRLLSAIERACEGGNLTASAQISGDIAPNSAVSVQNSGNIAPNSPASAQKSEP